MDEIAVTITEGEDDGRYWLGCAVCGREDVTWFEDRDVAEVEAVKHRWAHEEDEAERIRLRNIELEHEEAYATGYGRRWR